MTGTEKKLTDLRGISDKRATLLAKLGISRVRDLIFFYPRDYDDWTAKTPYTEWRDGMTVTVAGQLVQPLNINRRGRLNWIKSRVLTDDGDTLDVIWFNQPWLQKKLKLRTDYYFHGRLQQRGMFFSLNSPAFLTPEEYQHQGVQAIYSLTAGLNQNLMRSIVDQALAVYDGKLTDPLPDSLRKQHHLCTLDYALRAIHQPENMHEVALARERLAFEELFLVRAALYRLKHLRQSIYRGVPLETTPEAKAGMEHLLASLPFRPTGSQIEAINDILRDLRTEQPMNRLLQGDVGSGKTLVAAFAMAYTAWCGGQSVMMAPTSILASQHAESLGKIFAATDLKVALLTGGTTAAERRSILAGLETGETPILVGTHAVLEDDIVMRNPVLAITDEQHRFGVDQRSKLRDGKGEDRRVLHRLVMSATPIPRTLGLILYGDLDLSIMKQMPKGRQVIETRRARASDSGAVYRDLRSELEKGHQAYVICPLIEESDLMNLKSAEETYDELRKKVFPDKNVGLLHGNMKAKDKDSVMQSFIEGAIDILVSTTVVEVGVDNPNATFMIIENAERFGLAQLHQLRGRIGRGSAKSYCVLMSDTDEELANKRLTAIIENHDGFALAEEDLKLRGPGDFFGTRQHGLPAFKLINLYEDVDLIERVDAALTQMIAADPGIEGQDLKQVFRAVYERYPEMESGMTL